MSKEAGVEAGPIRRKMIASRAAIVCALFALAAAGGVAALQYAQNAKKARDWKPGEVVVGSERVTRMISGLPTRTAAGLSAADLSALWLAAFKTVQSGACAQVVGGGVHASSTSEAPGIYFVSCGASAAESAPQKWYRDDGHGVVACADAESCAAP